MQIRADSADQVVIFDCWKELSGRYATVVGWIKKVIKPASTATWQDRPPILGIHIPRDRADIKGAACHDRCMLHQDYDRHVLERCKGLSDSEAFAVLAILACC